MCARILVPGADHTSLGFSARLDRLERRLSIEADAATSSPPEPMAPVRDDVAPEPVATSSPPEPIEHDGDDAAHEEPAEESTETTQIPGSLGIADVRRLWPGVLDRVKELRRFTWVMLSQNAQVVSLEDDTLTLALVNAGARDSFVSNKSHEVVQQALHDVLGVTWRIDHIVDPTADPARNQPPSAETPEKTDTGQAGAGPDDAEKPGSRGVKSPDTVHDAMRNTQPGQVDDPDADAHPDDPVVDADGPEQLLSRELGAQVIDDQSGD
jgi:DNA polymerase-3 subunit gamma/tau